MENKARIANLTYKVNQKEAIISSLNGELKNKQDKLKQLAKLIKIRNISKEGNNSVLSNKINEIIRSEDNSNTFKEDTVFRTIYNKIVIIDTNQGKVTVQRRERQNERDNFLYWWNGMQLCGHKKENKFCFSVYADNLLVSSVEVEASENNCDRVIRRGNNIYFSVRDSGKLYKFGFEEDKLVLALLGNIANVAISLLEQENAVYVGTNKGKLFKIQNKTTEEILKTKGIPTDIQITGDELKTVDSAGNCYIYSLSQNEVLKQISVGNTKRKYNFLAGEYIVKSEAEYLTVFDWEGKEIKKVNNILGTGTFITTKIEGNTLLNNPVEGIAVFNHSTLELEYYKGGGTFDFCNYM